MDPLTGISLVGCVVLEYEDTDVCVSLPGFVPHAGLRPNPRINLSGVFRSN